jgi:hypothetical protein
MSGPHENGLDPLLADFLGTNGRCDGHSPLPGAQVFSMPMFTSPALEVRP